MNAKSNATETAWIDPDDAPELDDDFFERADEYVGEKLIRRGRPVGSVKASPKRQTTIRFDPEVLEGLRATGKGWQTRANDVLREWLKTRAA
ncbi:MAG: BrnA antitoxin family protein [Candidatus Accumulibacter sp.]|jgi:uncharacterized protein (DUF4415 family)|nr:BrnA antitoxin family protein [Accumulibacter sp.]